eukprot:6079574-Pleurochrysis_carterae.AAC.1
MHLSSVIWFGIRASRSRRAVGAASAKSFVKSAEQRRSTAALGSAASKAPGLCTAHHAFTIDESSLSSHDASHAASASSWSACGGEHVKGVRHTVRS